MQMEFQHCDVHARVQFANAANERVQDDEVKKINYLSENLIPIFIST